VLGQLGKSAVIGKGESGILLKKGKTTDFQPNSGLGGQDRRKLVVSSRFNDQGQGGGLRFGRYWPCNIAKMQCEV